MRGFGRGSTLGPCTLLLLLGLQVWGAWPPEVEKSLEQAGDKRPQLELVLQHYQELGDRQKLDAAEWLITHMRRHGYIVAAFYDRDKQEVPFEALDHADFATAQAAMDELERQHGPLDYGRKRRDEDVAHMTAELLIENIDLAFQAWQNLPWAKGMEYETFRNFVLPYRGSEEPIQSFRPLMMQRFASLASRMKDPTDAHEAAALIRADVDSLIRFSELYYLHPTDQSLDEMLERKCGRCEDITNMVMYAWRANGIAAASDYTPAWADRDNNHAWEVILDAKGRGSAGLSNRAAKVYRKMFAAQPEALGSQLDSGESAPRWLSGANYADATDQYLPVSDVNVQCALSPPEHARFAYLCVFNGGEWTAIHFGPIRKGSNVTFTKMGRNIVYLPAYYHEDKLLPAGPPFVLREDGTVWKLDGGTTATLAVEIHATAPEIADADTQQVKPRIPVTSGEQYEMVTWDPSLPGWQLHGQLRAGSEPLAFTNVPDGRLCWVKSPSGRNLERIFVIVDGSVVWY